MGVLSFLQSLIGKTTKITAENAMYASSDEQEAVAAAINLYAMFTVAEQVANIVSKVEFKTFYNGEETRGREWVNLNYRPNKNQSSTEFWKEVIFKLLIKNEVLIIPFNGQKIIADVFVKDDFAVAESTFTSVSRGTFSFNRYFKSNEVFYIKYCNEDITVLLNAINRQYAGLFTEACDKYLKSGGQKAALEIPAMASHDAKFEENLNNLMSDKFRKFFGSKNAVLPLTNGMKYNNLSADASKKASNEISDIKSVIDEALTRAAQVYKVPPQLVRGEVSGIDDAMDYLLTVCIDPLLNVIGEELTSKEFTDQEIIDGNYIEADSNAIRHIDMFDVADKVDKLISDGVTNVDEVRPYIGLKPLDTSESRRFYKTKNLERTDEGGIPPTD